MSAELFDMIKENRPLIKDSTIKMYLSNLRKLNRMIHDDNEKELENIQFLRQLNKVEEVLNEVHFTTKRNYLNAVIVVLTIHDDEDLLKEYQEIRDKLNQQYEDNQATGVISDKQKENFVDISEIHKVIDEIRNEIYVKKLRKKSDLSKKDFQLYMVYLLLNIYVKYPFRNDVAGMSVITKRKYNKLTLEDKTANNYIVVEKNKMSFVLNEYKTSKKYHEKIIPIDKELEKIFRMYFRLTNISEKMKNGESTILFVSSAGSPLTRNGISQLLLKTFKQRLGKSISTTMLRKIYLSSKYSNVKEEMEKDAHIMGHSVETQQKVYVKEKQEDEDMTEKPVENNPYEKPENVEEPYEKEDNAENPYNEDELNEENPYGF